MKVAVGSTNPVKIEAVRLGFTAVWPNETFEITGVSVQSDVPDQPMSDEESIRGARNRALRALEKTSADYGVGLEGGLQKIGDHHFQSGWAVIINKNREEGVGSSLRMMTPPQITEMLYNGVELGNAVDKVFSRTNSKHAEGFFGIMTKNAVTRTEAYGEGVIAALSRFVQSHLF